MMYIKTILDFLLGFCGLFCLVINKLLALSHRTGYEKQKRLPQFVLITSSKKRNTVFLLISVNVSVVVKFTEIGSVKY